MREPFLGAFELTPDEVKEHLNSIDVEAELCKILQDEIWKEIEATTGETKAMADQKIIDAILKLSKEKDERT